MAEHFSMAVFAPEAFESVPAFQDSILQRFPDVIDVYVHDRRVIVFAESLDTLSEVRRGMVEAGWL